MVLGFKPQFKQPILDGTKIHTIRQDPRRRWQQGKKIHMATGVRTKNYECFREDTCRFNQAIWIRPTDRTVLVGLCGGMHLLSEKGVDALAKNDGFNSTEDFWKWFNKDFNGVIVHWTDFIYG